MVTEELDFKVIADKVVHLGIGSERAGYYSPVAGTTGFLSQKDKRPPAWFESSCMLPESFCSDPRVAMALMDLVRKTGTHPAYGAYKWLDMMGRIRATPLVDDLPFAIVSAAMDILVGEDEAGVVWPFCKCKEPCMDCKQDDRIGVKASG